MAAGDPMSPRKRTRDESEERKDQKRDQGAEEEGR